MSNDADDNGAYLATLGLPPDATLAQVKARFRELNDAYLKILESSRRGAPRAPSDRAQAGASTAQSGQQPRPDSRRGAPSKETHTEPIAALKEKLAKGAIDKSQFEKLAKERYRYLEGKPFSELSDSEFEERLNGFEGLKIDFR